MNRNSNDVVHSSAGTLLEQLLAVKLPAAIVFILFVAAALLNDEIADRGLLPLVRFIGVLMLALGLYTSMMVGRFCAYSQKRWLVGHIAAGCIGFAGGLVWSAAAFGAGFFFFMLGTLLCALLIFKELERHTGRRLERQKLES